MMWEIMCFPCVKTTCIFTLHKCFLTLGSSSNTDKTADDLVEQVAADMMKEAWLLCFDEFQVTHISISASENLEVVVSKIFYLYPYLGK